MAWAGDALAQLYSATGMKAYLDGAVALGDWIYAHCRDDRGPGGYTGGYTGSGSKIEWKSTEHNIDVYAFFRLLARETGNPVWSSRSAWARRFILAMWDTAAGRFNVGTTGNGASQEYSPQVEDVEQLVVSGSAGPRVRAIARLGRASPGRDRGWLPRREHLHRQPHGRVVRGDRPPRGRAGTQPRASRPGPGGGVPRQISSTPRPAGRTRTASGSWPRPTTRSVTARVATCTPRCTPARPRGTSWPPAASTRCPASPSRRSLTSGAFTPGALRPGARRIPRSGDYPHERSRRECLPLSPLMPAQRCGRAAVGLRRSAEPGTPASRRTAVAPSPTAEATRLIER